jgi:hypothetical protein
MNEEAKKDKTVFRVAKNADNPFVMIDRRPIENPALSWKAKGILAYLLSRPDDWVIRFKDLVNRSTDGGHMVRAAMKELKAAGHIKVTTEREGGRITRWVYQVYEIPLVENQEVEKQQVKKRASTNKKVVTKKNSKDIKEGAAAPRANDFPSNVLFREVTERYPAKASWHDVLKFVDSVSQRLGRQPTKDDLAPFYTAWCNMGWNANSINWLEYAVKGVLPGKQNGKKTTDFSFVDEYVQEQGLSYGY